MELEIRGDQGYVILFHSQHHDKDGQLAYYSVTLTAPTMNAIIKVDNTPAPYGISPTSMFERMAKEWTGWEGEKSWGQPEREFDLTATADYTGHVTLTSSIYSGKFLPCAKMIIEFEIESGQLEQIKTGLWLFSNEQLKGKKLAALETSSIFCSDVTSP